MTDVELRAKVAVKMGWRYVSDSITDPLGQWVDKDDNALFYKFDLNNPSHWWMLVEEMVEKGFNWLVEHHEAYKTARYRCTFWTNPIGFGFSSVEAFSENDEIGRAIALAFCKAMEGSDG